MKKKFITRSTLTIQIIEKMIVELEFLKEDVQNHVFPFPEPPQEITTLEESIQFCVRDVYRKTELPVVKEIIESLSDDTMIQIY